MYLEWKLDGIQVGGPNSCAMIKRMNRNRRDACYTKTVIYMVAQSLIGWPPLATDDISLLMIDLGTGDCHNCHALL